jgi:hypothetical protein
MTGLLLDSQKPIFIRAKRELFSIGVTKWMLAFC